MSETPTNDQSLEKIDWDTNIAHARACYSNAQEVIRFVDTKTAVLTGIITVTTGLPLALLPYVLIRKSDESSTLTQWYNEPGRAKIILILGLAAILAGFCCGILSLLTSTNGLMSRVPRLGGDSQEPLLVEFGRVLLRSFTFGLIGKRTRKNEVLTSLFPIFRSDQADRALRNFRKLGEAAYTRSDVIKEYAAQLESVGSILNIKINRHRQSVVWFERQIFAYFLGVIAILVLLTFDSPFLTLGKKIKSYEKNLSAAPTAAATSPVP